MPAKGQTCWSCAGICGSVVKYWRPGGRRHVKHPLRRTVRYLKAIGYSEVYGEHDTCGSRVRGGCSEQDDKPALCRTYYCHGRLWASGSAA